jgi:hypothetical protein
MLYALLGGLGALGILALLVFGHLTIQSVVGIAIALSNAIGLIAGAEQGSEFGPALGCTRCCMTLFRFVRGVRARRRAAPLQNPLHLTQGCVAAPLAAARTPLMGRPTPQSAAACAAATARLRSRVSMPAPRAVTRQGLPPGCRHLLDGVWAGCDSAHPVAAGGRARPAAADVPPGRRPGPQGPRRPQVRVWNQGFTLPPTQYPSGGITAGPQGPRRPQVRLDQGLGFLSCPVLYGGIMPGPQGPRRPQVRVWNQGFTLPPTQYPSGGITAGPQGPRRPQVRVCDQGSGFLSCPVLYGGIMPGAQGVRCPQVSVWDRGLRVPQLSRALPSSFAGMTGPHQAYRRLTPTSEFGTRFRSAPPALVCLTVSLQVCRQLAAVDVLPGQVFRRDTTVPTHAHSRPVQHLVTNCAY